MKPVSPLAALILACGLVPLAQAVCESAPDAKCRLAALESVDQQLNVIFKRLVSTGTRDDQDRLRQEQRDWLARRDAACGLSAGSTTAPQWLNTVAENPTRTNCVHQQTLSRVRELQDRPTIALNRIDEFADAHEYNVPFTRRSGKAYAEVSFLAKGYPTKPPTPLMQVGVTDGKTLSGMQVYQSSMATQARPDGEFVVGIALDFDNGEFHFSQNGRWNSVPGSAAGADLETGGSYSIRVLSAGPPITRSMARGGIRVNTGDRPFFYDMPAGYQPFRISRNAGASVLPPTIVPSFQIIEGKPLSVWAERYWAWLLPKQPDRNPVLDTSGKYCAEDQAGPVWFLSSADARSRITRSCTIPRGKFILVPAVANLMHSTAGAQPCTKLETDGVGKDAANAIHSAFVTVDGERFDALYDYRVYTEKCTTIRGDAGEKIVSDLMFWGSWVLLYPLAEGDHVISFGGELPAINASRQVTYHIQVR